MMIDILNSMLSDVLSCEEPQPCESGEKGSFTGTITLFRRNYKVLGSRMNEELNP
jgi:hypothetical protein